MEFSFQSTVEPCKLSEVYQLSGSEWGAPLSAQDFAQAETKKFMEHLMKGHAGRAYYMESPDGRIAASCVVTHHPALYSEAENGNESDNGEKSGDSEKSTEARKRDVKEVTGLRVSFVFVDSRFRGQGLMSQIMKRTLAAEEAAILQKELETSSSFSSAVGRDPIDHDLAARLLGKKYFWYLYSAVDKAYTRFGFKACPVEAYRIAQTTNVTDEVEEMLGAKTLRLLDSRNAGDMELVSHIYEANQQYVDAELEKKGKDSERPEDSVPRFAIVSTPDNVEKQLKSATAIAQKAGSEENQQYVQFRGAVFTDKTSKTHYVLWSSIKSAEFYIVAMGELDPGSQKSVPKVTPNAISSTAQSHSIPQDLSTEPHLSPVSVLVRAAIYVAQKQWSQAHDSPLYVCVNDLPRSVPAAAMHGLLAGGGGAERGNNGPGPQIEFVPDLSAAQVMPMVRRYGLASADFDLAWIDNSIRNWG